jgi:Amt family ammonium transporter
LLTGVFASKTISGVTGSVAVQAMGVLAVAVYSAAATAMLLWVVKMAVGLRVDEDAERTGLDVAQHREHLGS